MTAQLTARSSPSRPYGYKQPFGAGYLALGLTLLLLPAACRRQPALPEARETGRSEPVPATTEAVSREPVPTVIDPASSEALDYVLQGGEKHAFAIDLAESQLLDLRVDQHGVDVVVGLLGPLGQPLLEVDNPSGADGAYGPERVFWVAERTGRYHLAIRAWGGTGASGRYSIRIEALRTVAPGDLDRVVAEKAKAAADALYIEGTGESRMRAIDLYDRALAGFVALGDDARRADTHYRLGETLYALGEKNRASKMYEAALPLYEAVDNERQQALILHQFCNLQIYQVGLALEQCERALLLWKVVGDRLGMAKTSNELGFRYRLLHEYQRALISYDRALELWRELGKPDQEARTLHNRGRVYAALGEYRQAVADLKQALAMRRSLGQQQLIALTLNSLGFLHAKWNVMESARRSFEEAYELKKDDVDLTVGNSLLGFGLTHEGSDNEQAWRAIRRSLEIFRAIGFRQGEAVALLGLGRIMASSNRHAKARDTLAEALEVFESIQDFSGIAETRLAIATAERMLGRLEEAKREIEQALAIVENLRTSVAAGNELRASFFASKQAFYEHYVDLLMEYHSRWPAYGYEAEALAASERARARSLIEALADRRTRLRQGADRRLLEEEVLLERQIYTNQARIQRLLESQNAEPAAARQLKRAQLDFQRQYKKLQGRIRLSSPRSADLTQPRLVSIQQIQERVLDSESLLLEYKLGDRRSFLWAVTPETITAFELPARDEIEERATSTYRRISGNKRIAWAKAQQELAALSRLLLEPVAEQLSQARRLLIVTDGALQYIPFEALPIPGSDLSDPESAERVIAAVDVVYLPSAATLAFLRDQLANREPAPRLLAVLADPVFSCEDPRFPLPVPDCERSAEDGRYQRLTHSALEAETILSLVPAESRFAALGFDASRDALISGKLGLYRILHFATHGNISSEHAGLSRLVLSLYDARGQPREDGFWYAYEIYRQDLPAELVVLSACQTALGEEILGEGLVGLTRSFMNAGSGRVLVSLWRVDDKATAALMGRFYENLLVRRLSPPAALRAAKDFIRGQRKWRAPYFWAGFVLQGEWRDIHR